MATDINNVIQTFHRYYGRDPRVGKDSVKDMKTVNWLTQFPPNVVEQKLSVSSPITGGKLWADFQKQKENAQNNDTSQNNEEWINSLPIGDDGKALMRIIDNSNELIGANPVRSPEDAARLLAQITKNAEVNVGTYYDQIKGQDLDALKDKMADLRQTAARYTQKEEASYKDKLRTTKNELSARGATFSGQTRLLMGSQSAVGANDANQKAVEGTMQRDRRQNWEDVSSGFQTAARDMGRAAELRYGSRAIGDIQGEFGQISNPYDGKSLNYNVGRTTDAYNVRRMKADGTPQEGYVLNADQQNLIDGPGARRYMSTYETERQAAIKRARDADLTRAGYTP